jgi:hypothetical protein
MSSASRMLQLVKHAGRWIASASNLILPISIALIGFALVTSAESQPATKKAPRKGRAAAIAAPARNADGTIPDAIAKRGVETRVATAWDCNQPDVAPAIFAHAENGSISIKQGTGPSCGRASMRITVVFYTSNPGFKGTDKLIVMGLLIGGQFEKTLTVLVK